jgi:hypothetical protein
VVLNGITVVVSIAAANSMLLPIASAMSPTGRIEQMYPGSTATAETFVLVARTGCQEPLDAGATRRSPGRSTPEIHPKARFTIRSADDQEVDWEAGPDLCLRKHPIRDWWRSPAPAPPAALPSKTAA